MPARDKTGPEGRGPMTGWGFGNCTQFRRNQNLDPRPVGGRGWRAGRRGWFNGPFWGYGREYSYSAIDMPGRVGNRSSENSDPSSMDNLKEWVQQLQSQLDAISRQLTEEKE